MSTPSILVTNWAGRSVALPPFASRSRWPSSASPPGILRFAAPGIRRRRFPGPASAWRRCAGADQRGLLPERGPETGRMALSSTASSAAKVGRTATKLTTPAATEAANMLRREGIDGFCDMIVLREPRELGVRGMLGWRKILAVRLAAHLSIALANYQLWYSGILPSSFEAIGRGSPSGMTLTATALAAPAHTARLPRRGRCRRSRSRRRARRSSAPSSQSGTWRLSTPRPSAVRSALAGDDEHDLRVARLRLCRKRASTACASAWVRPCRSIRPSISVAPRASRCFIRRSIGASGGGRCAPRRRCAPETPRAWLSILARPARPRPRSRHACAPSAARCCA